MSAQVIRPIAKLPGPKGLPLLGNVLQLDLAKLHLIVEEWADHYGEIYKFKIFNKTAVAISNIELIHQILRDRPETFRRISAMESVSRESETNGVLTSEGDHWRWQRAVTMQAFKPECLRRFFPTMLIINQRLYDRWHHAAATGQTVDIERDWMKYTVDIATNFAFGYDINTLTDSDDSFQRHLEKQLPFFNRRVNSPFPYWHFFTLPSDREANQSLDVIKETIRKFVEKAQQRLEQQPELASQPSNFLEALLVSEDDNGNRFSYVEIQGNIISILLAGEDTSAHTLAWLIYFMTEHPDVQLKMQQEVDAVLDENVMPQDLATLDKLDYIEAAINETMRLKSVVPITFLEPNLDVEVGDIAIPKGTTILLMTRHCGKQEKNFSQPENFNPERWLDAIPAGCTHNRNASLPFGAGPRFCAARNLAMMEMKMAIAMVCKNFNVRRVDTGKPVTEAFSFTLMPENLMVRFEKR